jgi:hypothetical protein
MKHRLSSCLVLSLALVSTACTDDGGSDTSDTEETLCHCDGTTAEEDTDPGTGDGDGDPTTGDGDGDGDGDPTTGDGDGDGDPTTGDGDFADVYQLFVDEGCTAGYCHGADANGLTMTDEATTYMNLVGVAATTAVCGLTERVVAGEPDQSILWMRVRPAALDGGMPCAVKMPNDGTDNGLAEAEAQIVYDWIAGGALP